MFSTLEGLGDRLQNELNERANAFTELGWELRQVQVISDADFGNNGLVCVYRRTKE